MSDYATAWELGGGDVLYTTVGHHFSIDVTAHTNAVKADHLKIRRLEELLESTAPLSEQHRPMTRRMRIVIEFDPEQSSRAKKMWVDDVEVTNIVHRFRVQGYISPFQQSDNKSKILEWSLNAYPDKTLLSWDTKSGEIGRMEGNEIRTGLMAVTGLIKGEMK